MNFVRPLAASMFCACMLPSAVSSVALAQTYPERPVTIVAAFAPGGADDATARILQDRMQKPLGQPIVVENVTGAAGMIPAATSPPADPEGTPILLHQARLRDART